MWVKCFILTLIIVVILAALYFICRDKDERWASSEEDHEAKNCYGCTLAFKAMSSPLSLPTTRLARAIRSPPESIPIEPNLPENFDCREKWPGLITPALNQLDCGSCWAYSTASVFTDKLKIKSGGSVPKASGSTTTHNYISPQNLATCNACDGRSGPKAGTQSCMDTICGGGYIDLAFQYLCDTGGIAIGDDPSGIKGKYICETHDGKQVYKGKRKYRVTKYDYGELNPKHKCRAKLEPERLKTLEDNCLTIMTEIYRNGPVACLFKNYTNCNSFSGGSVYSKAIGKDLGYHAVSIIGWGREPKSNKPYWIVRNSWGPEWAEKGCFKVLRGIDFCEIESDVYGIEV